MNHYPMTREQRQALDQDLSAIMENLKSIANLVRACYGDMDATVTRAEEATGAVQRLIWAVEQKDQVRSGNAA